MRDNAVTLLVGGRGRRKTTYIKDVIWKLRDKRRIVVVDTFDSPVWRHLGTIVAGQALNQEMADYKIPTISINQLSETKPGVYRIFNSDTNLMLQEIQRRCSNCLVILEDATRFIEGNITQELKKFVLDTKQINVDMIMVFHALKLVPSKLSMFSDFLVLFKTQELWNSDLGNRFPQPGVMDEFLKLKEDKDEFKKVTIDLRA
jgi:hypothetical protein